MTLVGAQLARCMEAPPRIVAHIIVGQKPEPYFAAALESIADACDCVVVNDNSGSAQSVNALTAAQSRLGRSGRLVLVRTAFSDFSAARNACIEATPEQFRDGWALFTDADEVHGLELRALAAVLPRLGPEVDAVDGYSRHFVGSFSWWMSVERRRRFFRLAPGRRWYGSVHEQLQPLRDVVVLPAVWCHYGHVVTPRAEAEKSRLYALLGGGDAPSEDVLAIVTPEMVWRDMLRRANRFAGSHPPAALDAIAALSRERAAIFAAVDAAVARQRAADRLRNLGYRVNIARLLAWRALEARLRWGWPSTADDLRGLSYA